MSTRISIIYGFGFHCDCNDEALIEFIKKHKIRATKKLSKADAQYYTINDAL